MNLRSQRTSHPQNQTQPNLPGHHEGCPIVSPLSHANATEAARKVEQMRKGKTLSILEWNMVCAIGMRTARAEMSTLCTLIVPHPTHPPVRAECSCKTAFSYRQYFPQLFVIWSRNGYRFLFCILRLCDFQAFSWAKTLHPTAFDDKADGKPENSFYFRHKAPLSMSSSPGSSKK